MRLDGVAGVEFPDETPLEMVGIVSNECARGALIIHSATTCLVEQFRVVLPDGSSMDFEPSCDEVRTSWNLHPGDSEEQSKVFDGLEEDGEHWLIIDFAVEPKPQRGLGFEIVD